MSQEKIESLVVKSFSIVMFFVLFGWQLACADSPQTAHDYYNEALEAWQIGDTYVYS